MIGFFFTVYSAVVICKAAPHPLGVEADLRTTGHCSLRVRDGFDVRLVADLVPRDQTDDQQPHRGRQDRHPSEPAPVVATEVAGPLGDMQHRGHGIAGPVVEPLVDISPRKPPQDVGLGHRSRLTEKSTTLAKTMGDDARDPFRKKHVVLVSSLVFPKKLQERIRQPSSLKVSSESRNIFGIQRGLEESVDVEKTIIVEPGRVKTRATIFVKQGPVVKDRGELRHKGVSDNPRSHITGPVCQWDVSDALEVSQFSQLMCI